MRSIILLIVCLPAFILQSSAQKKVNRKYFISLLNAGEYGKVFDSATKLRKEVYGKNAVVDYFIAKSLCLDGRKENSTFCFNRIIKNFKLSGIKKTFIQQEITTCSATTALEETEASTNPDFSYINNVSLPEASVGGKMGKVYDCFNKNQTMDLSQMVPPEELESRLFAINQKMKAVEKIKGLLDTRYRIDTAGRYVFVSLKNAPLDSVNYATESLEKAYHFFVNFYALRAPDKLLTVYILPNQQALRQTATLVHGIKLPDPNIGYSNLSDLSLLGLGQAKQMGTLYHELFHLIIRTDLGDIPAFIDEGLASLYSVSSWKNGQLLGDYRPWRLEDLREASNARDAFLKIPLLQNLINYGWDEFDGEETKNVCQVAVNYALSNFLMIYLQDKNLLQQLVTAFKNRPFVPENPAAAKTNLQLFESVVKDSIQNFSLEFDAWFKNRYNFNLYGESNSSTINPINIPQKFENIRVQLYEINEKVFKYKQPSTYNQLEDELKTIEADFRNQRYQLPTNNMNKNANIMQQSVPVDTAAAKNKDIQNRLEAFDKKLRKIIFNSEPKKAN